MLARNRSRGPGWKVVDEAGAAPAGGASPRVGEIWRYELVDKMTRTRRDVVYRVDRVEGDRVTFNQGARVEMAPMRP